MERKAAQIISYIFHPVLIPVYTLLVLLNNEMFYSSDIPVEGKLMLLALAVLTCVILPLFLMVIYQRLGWITSFYLENRKERKLPLLTMGFALLIMGIMLQRLQVATVFYLLFLASAVLTVVLLLISNFWKISLHTSAVSAMAGALFTLAIKAGVDFFWMIMLTVLVAGVTGYARLKLKTHNAAQVYTGYAVGFSVFFLLLYFL